MDNSEKFGVFLNRVTEVDNHFEFTEYSSYAGITIGRSSLMLMLPTLLTL